MTQPFVHLHNHTHYSLLDGACRIDELMDSVQEQGMSAVAMTDHGNMFATVEFYRAAVARGVHPILGIEAYVAPGSRTGRQMAKGERNSHLVLLARDEIGYRNLLQLTSKSFLEGFYYKPRIDRELLKEHGRGLIALSGCLNGEVNSLLRQERYEEARAAARFYSEVFDGGFYLELQNHGLPQELLAIPRLVDLAREMDLPLVVTNDCHYLRPEHAAAHDALLCIQTGKTRGDADRLHFDTHEMYVKSPQEMYTLFAGLEEALRNTVSIAEACQVRLEFGKLQLPHFPPPPPFADLDAYLRHLCLEGLRRRYEEGSAELRGRLDYELGVITQMGYAGYFLVVQDFILFARSQGIPVGPGRGSAAGSLVAYCLGITNIDPIRYNLLFERFLNPERISMPDIDVDFSDRGRARVIQYVVEKYGTENVCQIITFGTMAARAVVRDVGRVQGMPYSEVDRIAKLVPAELGIKLEKALEQSPELKALHDSDPRVQELIGIARVLEGLARHASTHAAGVVITPTALTDYLPLYRSSEEEVTTQFDMGACEKIGLLKMDFLGLRTLTVIQDCLAMLQEAGRPLDLESLPLDDGPAFELLSRGDTVGIFQFESSGMAEYLRKLRPACLEDMIAMNALYRPGPLGSGMIEDFIGRKQGLRRIEFEHPLLESILKETYGVIVYQEQVMQIASALAGYSLGEADLLRRAMGKKKAEIMDEQHESFVQRAVTRGVPRAVAVRVFDLMAHFAGYGFNKSHSAGYALVAYQTAYLKAHYPVEFLAASLTSEMSNSDRVMILLAECRRCGIAVRPPHIDLSQDGFAVEEGAIRFGLGAVKGVGHGAVEAIRAARESGPFLDLFDLCERTDHGAVNRKCLEALIHAGALDCLGPSRAQLMEGLPLALEWAVRARREREMGQGSLFGGGEQSPLSDRPQLPQVKSWESEECLKREKAALGFYVSGHPLDAWRTLLERLGAQGTHLLEEMDDGADVVLSGIPVQIKLSTDKKGKPMAFVSLEDFTGSVECIAFSDPYAQCREHLAADRPLLLKGRLSTREQEKPKVMVEAALGLKHLVESGQLTLHLALSSTLEEGLLAGIRGHLSQYPGCCPVFLHVDHSRMGGVQMKLRGTRIQPDPELLTALEGLVGPGAVRLTVGEPRGVRSTEIFGDRRKPARVRPPMAATAAV